MIELLLFISLAIVTLLLFNPYKSEKPKKHVVFSEAKLNEVADKETYKSLLARIKKLENDENTYRL